MTKEAIGTGQLDNGRVQWENAERFTKDLKTLGNGAVVVKVKLQSASAVRSARANAYYWSSVLTPMSNEGSDGDQSPEDIHDAMCQMFLPDEQKRVEFLNRMTGETMTVETDGRRTSKLKGDEFYTFVEKVRKFALEFMGVETEDPDPNYWRRRAQKAKAA